MHKLLLCLAFGSATMFGAVIANGSFESGTDPGAFLSVSPGDTTTITNWTVGGGGVDYIGTYWTAEEGNRSIDLSGTSAGTLSQTFATTVGQSYLVTFFLAGNPAGGNTVKSVSVDATGGSSQTYTFDTTGASTTNMNWATETYSFTASAASTTLTFTSLENNAFGPALDNVSIADAGSASGVPEPSSYALMLIGGVSLLAKRRFQSK